MIKVKIQKAENEWVEVAEVDTLDDARTIVKFLDTMFKNNWLPDLISFYNESTEITAWEGEKFWEYADQDPSGASDGVWFGGG